MYNQYSSTKLPSVINKRLYIHILLFVVTFFSTALAGVQWANKDFTELLNWHYGLTYAVLIMTFLTAHEFGHYIAARLHKIDSTLPFYIPIPIPYINFFGTMGAVIKTRTPFTSRKALFDVGVAGPIAGFVVSFTFLCIGLLTLPSKEFIYSIHPEYLRLAGGAIPATGLHFGDTLLYEIMTKLLANPNGFLPPMNEIYHYPFLNVGWFGLFVTALNLIPIGQLDGGHVVYAMFGKKWHSLIARVFWWTMLIIGFGTLLSLLHESLQTDYPGKFYIFFQDLLYNPLNWLKHNFPWYMEGWGGWLFWALITKFLIKLDHPVIEDDEKLGTIRTILGWCAIAILILCFSYNGIYFLE